MLLQDSYLNIIIQVYKGIPRDDSFKGKAVNDNPKDLVYPITPKLISREKLYEALAYKRAKEGTL